MLKDILKKWYFWFIIILFTIVIPIAINFSYFVGYKYSMKANTMINAGEAFLGYSAILTFVGSVFLASVAIWQNRVLMEYQLDQIKKNEESLLVVYQIAKNEKIEIDDEGYNSICRQIKKSEHELYCSDIVMKLTNCGKAVIKALTIHLYLSKQDHKRELKKYSYTQSYILAPDQSRYFSFPAVKGHTVSGYAIEVESIFGRKMYGHFFLISIGDKETISDYQIFPNIQEIEELIQHQTELKINYNDSVRTN